MSNTFPTKDSLIAQRKDVLLQRSTAKDQIEQAEKTIGILNAMIQTYEAIEAQAAEAVNTD